MTFTRPQLRQAVNQLRDNQITVREFKSYFSRPGTAGTAWIAYNYLEGSTTVRDHCALKMEQAIDWLIYRELNFDFFFLRREN